MEFFRRLFLIAEEETGEIVRGYNIDTIGLQRREVTESGGSDELDIWGSSRVSWWARRVWQKDIEDYRRWVFVSEVPGPIGFTSHSSVSPTRGTNGVENISEHLPVIAPSRSNIVASGPLVPIPASPLNSII